MRKTSSERFHRDLLTVSDSVGKAITDSKLGDVEDGLALYAQLVRSVLEMRRKYELSFQAPAPASWLNPHGREMESLSEDLRGFVDRAWRVADPDVLNRVQRFLGDLLTTLQQCNQAHAHQEVLRLAGRFYFRSLQNETSVEERATIGRSLLMNVRSYAEYRLYLDEPVQSDDLVYFQQVVRFLFTCTRMAVDAKPMAIDVKQSRVEGSLIESRRLLGKVDLRYRRDASAANPSLAYVQNYASGFLLGLAGFVMLLRERSRIDDEECAALLGPICTQLRQFSIEDALQAALMENSDYPWSNWEMELWPDGVDGGAIGALEGWIRKVSSIELAYRSRPPRATVSGLAGSFSAEHLLRRLAAALNELSVQEWVVLAYPNCPSADRLQTYATELAAAADELAEEEKDAQALIPLDPTRIDEFAEEVARVWTQITTLRGDLKILPDAAEPPPHWFGISQLYSRVFFIHSDVMADPADLGRNLGQGLVEGETSAILQVLDGLPTVESTADELTRNVSAALDRLRRQGLDPTVIVISSYSAMRTLSGVDWFSETEMGEFENASVVLEYANHPATCFVVDMKSAVEVRRWRPRIDTGDDAQYRADGRLVVSVRGITAELAAELLAANPNLGKDATGTEQSSSEAIRRLMHNAHVRCWTNVEIAPGEMSAGVAFRLPDDY